MIKTYTTKELVLLLTISRQAIAYRASRESWQSQPRQGRGGGFEWLYNSMPQTTQLAIRSAEEKNALEHEQENAKENSLVITYANPMHIPFVLDEKRRKKAVLKADLLRLYVDFQTKKDFSVKNKELFITAYTAGAYPKIYEEIGTVSWKSLERWRKNCKDEGSINAMADKRGIAHRGKSILTKEHERIILGQVLNTNAPLVAQCFRRINARCMEAGLYAPSEATVRRFVKRYQSENNGEFVFFREGNKAYKDKCRLSIRRNWSLREVGDVIIADGHVLNFDTINPETGVPKRMTLLLFYDGASNYPLGWEIMPTENVQCISSAFRRACMRLGKFPKSVYLDNGKAFRAKFFEGSKDLQQSGILGHYESLGVEVVDSMGIYESLDIEVTHAKPYNAESKTIERFFGTMHDLEVFMSSYVGNCIANKPPRLHRNEKLHKKLHEKIGYTPTLEETHFVIGKWFDEYANRPSRAKHLKGNTPLEVFENGKGVGLTKTELERLDLFMLQKEIRSITKDGFTLHGKLYWDEALANRRHKILVRYDDVLADGIVKVYTLDGHFICYAYDRDRYGIASGIDPMAKLSSDERAIEKLEDALALQKRVERQSTATFKEITEAYIIPETRRRNEAIRLKQERQLGTSRVIEAIPVLTNTEIQAFEAEKQRRLEAENAKPSYTPSNSKRFSDSLARYQYLFEIQYEQNIELVLEDTVWFEKFEQTTEYTRNYKNRFDSMRGFYERQQATG